MTPDSIWFAVRDAQRDVTTAAIVRGFPALTVQEHEAARRSADQLRAWQQATRTDVTDPNHTPTPTQEVAHA
ncbi:hypothetical protein [Micromonospora sp. NPDC049891]|uniref:hypothetical protein n=1 Tax=Micromonospora sp. NPDC049891 TaxID=3155655 RepID=UPI0033C90D91